MRARDAEGIEQLGERVGAGGEVLLGELGGLARPPEADLIDGQDVEPVGQHAERPAEVRPRRRARPTAVQQQHRVRGRVAALVVVKSQSRRQLGESARRRCVEHRYSHASWTLRPSSNWPYITRTFSGSLIACTRPACASRQNRWIGVPERSARPPALSKSRSTAAMPAPVAFTWSRRTRTRKAIGTFSPRAT